MKKKFKKILCLAAAAAMVFSMTACGGGSGSGSEGSGGGNDASTKTLGYFNEYVIGGEYTMEIISMEKGADASLFEIPSGYTMMEY